ncbi:MAG: helix-turn-helix domain-containing protein, partial [Chloroflexia bacterium]|nr:helix-turn-helix domain-containing protein [Chloroflexia bacterium]
MRARIILLADAGVGVHETARELDIGRATVQRWRKRWLAGEGRAFAERLCDAPRPGTADRRARADLRDHRLGLRATERKRAPFHALDPRRFGNG